MSCSRCTAPEGGPRSTISQPRWRSPRPAPFSLWVNLWPGLQPVVPDRASRLRRAVIRGCHHPPTSPWWNCVRATNYTLLSGFRLPWPPSGCLDALTPFVVSDERAFRHLNLAFGSSRIASSAYQKWPTSNDTFKCPRSIKQQGLLTYLKFENRLRLFQPQGL